MIIESLGKDFQVRKYQATRAIIRDEFANPIAILLHITPTHVRIFHAGEEDFQEQLRNHGIDKTLVIDRIDSELLSR